MAPNTPLSFDVAVRERDPNEGEEQPIQLKDVDGAVAEYVAVRPRPEVMVMLSNLNLAKIPQADRIATVSTLVPGMFTEESAMRLIQRLLGHDDDLDADQLFGYMKALQEHWSGKPGGSPRASSRRSPKAGTKSTRRSR